MNAPCKVGDRIRLDLMGADPRTGNPDPNPIPVGTTGTVTYITPIGDTVQIGVKWDIERSLALVWPVDQFTVLPAACGLYRTDTEGLDECLRLMFPDLLPDDLRTEGGNINMPKVRALWRERTSGVPASSNDQQEQPR